MRNYEEEALLEICSSAKELQQRIGRHFDLVDRVLAGRKEEFSPDAPRPLPAGSSREPELRAAIREAIDTLEGTRKAFKSKTLERLRKKLTQVLIDLE